LTSSVFLRAPAVGASGGSLLLEVARRRRLALALLGAGLAAHTLGLATRAWYRGAPAPSNIFTESYFLPWCFAALAIAYRDRLGRPGRALALLAPLCLFSALALALPEVTPPPSPVSECAFAPAYHLLDVLAHSLFILGGWFALLFLARRTEGAAFKPLVIWGFIAYSAAQLLGAIWSYLGWTVPFHWSERHLQSACIWCFYCASLHLHVSPRWSPRGKAWLALGGSVVVLIAIFSYYLTYASMVRTNG
jgi:ABC-type transport system involved in cytochrome c biogenesis permease subunit